MQPSICNQSAPVLADCANNEGWLIPVNDLSEVTNPSRDHAYVLPDETFWAMSHDGTQLVQIGGAVEGDNYKYATIVVGDDIANCDFVVDPNNAQEAINLAIQTAGDMQAVGGRVIINSEFILQCTAPIIMDRIAVVLEGQGLGIILRKNFTDADYLILIQENLCEVKNLEIATSVGSFQIGTGIEIQNATLIKLENVSIDGFDQGVYNTGGRDLTCLNSYFNGNTYSIRNAGIRGEIVNNKFEGNAQCHIYISDQASYNVVANNRIVGGQTAIRVDQGKINTIITGNMISNPIVTGIELDASRCLVNSNIIHLINPTLKNSILMLANAVNGTVQANILTKNIASYDPSNLVVNNIE